MTLELYLMAGITVITGATLLAANIADRLFPRDYLG